MQLGLRLDLDHTKFTQDRPPVQSDIVPSCNGLSHYQKRTANSFNIYPSASFYTYWRIHLLTVIIIIIPIFYLFFIPITIIVLGLLP